MRLHVIIRDTADESWRVANRLHERVDDATVRNVQEGLASSESEGQRRIRDLHHGGYRSDLTVAPEPLGRRGGAGTEFILSGYRS